MTWPLTTTSIVVFFDEFIVVNGVDVCPGTKVIVPVWGGVAFLARQMATMVTFPVFVIFHEYVLVYDVADLVDPNCYLRLRLRVGCWRHCRRAVVRTVAWSHGRMVARGRY